MSNQDIPKALSDAELLLMIAFWRGEGVATSLDALDALRHERAQRIHKALVELRELRKGKARLLEALILAKGQMWGRNINADLHAEVQAVIDAMEVK